MRTISKSDVIKTAFKLNTIISFSISSFNIYTIYWPSSLLQTAQALVPDGSATFLQCSPGPGPQPRQPGPPLPREEPLNCLKGWLQGWNDKACKAPSCCYELLTRTTSSSSFRIWSMLSKPVSLSFSDGQLLAPNQPSGKLEGRFLARCTDEASSSCACEVDFFWTYTQTLRLSLLNFILLFSSWNGGRKIR